MGLDHWIRDERGNVRPATMMEWGRWLETTSDDAKRVAHAAIGDDVVVSTVFLGMDHGFPPDPHRPVLWETLVFGGVLDGEMCRYRSEEEALRGHREMVARVLAVNNPLPPSPY